MFDINDLVKTAQRPLPYEPGEELWNDPYISGMMLKSHLSPDTDAASFKPDKIKAICEYLPDALHLKKGCSIVDLGCGPGLYCSELAKMGFQLTGFDMSENSIRYAKEQDEKHRISFIQANYFAPFGFEQFDVAMLIYEDYGVMSLANRTKLLKNVYNALKPGGQFVLDVSSLTAFKNRRKAIIEKWYASDAGFWRPHKHFILEKDFVYPDISAMCNLVAVFDTELKIYRIYQTFYSPESIRSELEKGGFCIQSILSNLWGEKYTTDSPVIGIICTKA